MSRVWWQRSVWAGWSLRPGLTCQKIRLQRHLLCIRKMTLTRGLFSNRAEQLVHYCAFNGSQRTSFSVCLRSETQTWTATSHRRVSFIYLFILNLCPRPRCAGRQRSAPGDAPLTRFNAETEQLIFWNTASLWTLPKVWTQQPLVKGKTALIGERSCGLVLNLLYQFLASVQKNSVVNHQNLLYNLPI